MFSSTILMGRSQATAVAISWMFIWMLPSPENTMTSRSGKANWAPIAAGSPKPMVPSPPEVIIDRGFEKPYHWAAHIWCWPTSVTT